VRRPVRLTGEVDDAREQRCDKRDDGVRASLPFDVDLPSDSAAFDIDEGARRQEALSSPSALGVNRASRFDVGVSRDRKGCGGQLLF
jgi:hypothetical protein